METKSTHSSKKPLLVSLGVLTLVLVFIGGFFALDLYLHSKFDLISASNRAGYRGTIVGKKQPGEIRVVLLGGSTAQGYGVAPDQMISTLLEKKLNAAGNRKWSIINLAQNNIGAAGFIHDLKFYHSLDYDGVIMYGGYDDLGLNKNIGRYENPLFRVTGYFPITTLILSEKAKLLRYGTLDPNEWNGKTVFRAGMGAKAQATAMETLVEFQRSLEKTMGKLTHSAGEKPEAIAPSECSDQWANYCNGMAEAIDFALKDGKKVFVAQEAYVSDTHFDQQRNLFAMLKKRFQDPKLHVLDLGYVIDPKNPELAFDHVHLTAKGSDIVASHFVAPLQTAFQN